MHLYIYIYLYFKIAFKLLIKVFSSNLAILISLFCISHIISSPLISSFFDVDVEGWTIDVISHIIYTWILGACIIFRILILSFLLFFYFTSKSITSLTFFYFFFNPFYFFLFFPLSSRSNSDFSCNSPSATWRKNLTLFGFSINFSTFSN